MLRFSIPYDQLRKKRRATGALLLSLSLLYFVFYKSEKVLWNVPPIILNSVWLFQLLLKIFRNQAIHVTDTSIEFSNDDFFMRKIHISFNEIEEILEIDSETKPGIELKTKNKRYVLEYKKMQPEHVNLLKESLQQVLRKKLPKIYEANS